MLLELPCGWTAERRAVPAVTHLSFRPTVARSPATCLLWSRPPLEDRMSTTGTAGTNGVGAYPNPNRAAPVPRDDWRPMIVLHGGLG